ncbi:hypothetical protein DFA_12180 [Cavenderia fasciculata]|uniref:Uncharacterized protein n=1 Tax=Cavenderia fasciculata TaxID=261658 RepID=F4QCI0_CACFS|nr:uncharacterized protein DFA_12180 [Cavenderia fasciculata]EGG14408.1 hypothetical protein DFA_12180 [Cavenderia fasciculata]|eukprot:XP_004353817.1 hypothetical protein DFA_12180 [Cavenderia fasciculata]
MMVNNIRVGSVFVPAIRESGDERVGGASVIRFLIISRYLMNSDE